MQALSSVFSSPSASVLAMPVPGKGDRTLHVFDGVPCDDQPWLAAAVTAAQSLALKGDDEVLALTMSPLGAPLGPFERESARVARSTGVTVEADDSVSGAVLAQGTVQAFWVLGEDNQPELVMEFSEPSAFCFMGNSDTFAVECARTRCIRQYTEQGLSVLNNLALPDFAVNFHVSFTGYWGPETQLMKRSLETTMHTRFVGRMESEARLLRAAA